MAHAILVFAAGAVSMLVVLVTIGIFQERRRDKPANLTVVPQMGASAEIRRRAQ
jgi:hypothetical protein